ncbi:MAG: hypothetical protein P8J33_04925 [Pirellulaceae bacterium]|nr:hypothetical protein [Pirellulaceae bacterium]
MRKIIIPVLLVALAVSLVSATTCEAQQKKVWTRSNIQTWIDSDKQKRAKRNFIRTLNPHERAEYNRPDWFIAPEMKVKSSVKGQLGRLIFPAYKVIKILDKQKAIIEVTDEQGQRYMIVFNIGDTSKIKIDHRAHISPEKFNFVLFERMGNFLYRDSQNVRKSLAEFKKIDPASVIQK